MNLLAPFRRVQHWSSSEAPKRGAAIRARRTGRLVALGFLVAAIVIRLWDPLPVAVLRFEIFDAYQRWMPRVANTLDVLVVDIDEPSIEDLGQWPWPRSILADLVDVLLKAGVRGVFLDINFAEPDRMSPPNVAEEVPGLDPVTSARLRGLPDTDAGFAEVIANGPVVLAEAVLAPMQRARSEDGPGVSRAAFATIGPDPHQFLPAYPELLRTVEPLASAASGHGINSLVVDRDGILRRMPLLFSVDGDLYPAVPLELFRVGLGESTIRVRADEAGIQSVGVGPVSIPTDERGQILLAFGPVAPERYLSARDVLSGQVDAERFADRFVIVGSRATGLKDFRATPVAPEMPGVGILAQTIESLLARTTLSRPSELAALELLILIVVGVGLVALVPRFGAKVSILLANSVGVILVLASVALFRTEGLFLDWSYVVIAGTVINTTMVFAKSIEERRSREEVGRELTLVQREMEAAARVQQAILPTTFPGTDTLKLHAGTWPARDVGGDFYDVFGLPDGRIGFVVADVSGKGMDAALFMAVARTLLKSHAQTIDDPAACLGRLNDDLSEDNETCMFVTVFYGILDLESGRIDFANGGHNPPYLMTASTGEVAQVCPTEGFAIGIVPGAPYLTRTTTLAPGDALVLYSDGVTEAFSPAGEEFTEARLEALLKGARVMEAPALVDDIVAGVRAFASTAPQSDDITCMVVFRGPPEPATAITTGPLLEPAPA